MSGGSEKYWAQPLKTIARTLGESHSSYRVDYQYRYNHQDSSIDSHIRYEYLKNNNAHVIYDHVYIENDEKGHDDLHIHLTYLHLPHQQLLGQSKDWTVHFKGKCRFGRGIVQHMLTIRVFKVLVWLSCTRNTWTLWKREAGELPNVGKGCGG